MLVFILFMSAGTAETQQNKLSWSLALQSVKTGDLVSFSAPVQSMTGEQFRLVINANAACYAYVIYESPDGSDVAVLYSGALKSGEPWYSDVLELALPRGSESFYVIASKDEQKTLDQRVSAFAANPGSTQRRALMNEVFRIRSDASKFREAPEKPVLMGGASRGSGSDKNQGVEYSGVDTYVKTISIEH